MKVTWLGQAGLLFEKQNINIMVDPYLSNSVAKTNKDFKRNVDVDKSFLKTKLNIIILTHNHLDHTDPETLSVLLKQNENLEILAPYNSWCEVKKIGYNHNYILFERNTKWTSYNIEFTAVKAYHSDLTSIGVIIDVGEKKYYITGDTLYNTEIFNDLPNDIDTVFLPINGRGNNMNMTDAQKFAAKTKAKHVVPLHFGMFDNLNPNNFKCQNKIIPEIYKEIIL